MWSMIVMMEDWEVLLVEALVAVLETSQWVFDRIYSLNIGRYLTGTAIDLCQDRQSRELMQRWIVLRKRQVTWSRLPLLYYLLSHNSHLTYSPYTRCFLVRSGPAGYLTWIQGIGECAGYDRRRIVASTQTSILYLSPTREPHTDSRCNHHALIKSSF